MCIRDRSRPVGQRDLWTDRKRPVDRQKESRGQTETVGQSPVDREKGQTDRCSDRDRCTDRWTDRLRSADRQKEIRSVDRQKEADGHRKRPVGQAERVR